MKKILKNLLFVTLIFATLITSVACGEKDGDTVSYSESGLNFTLPKYMKKMSVEYADICYGNFEDGTEFFVYFYSSEQLLVDLILSKDSTVKEYADWFVAVNNYSGVEEAYDEEGRKITLSYIYQPEQTYYCDYILRNEYALFHITMCCKAELMETYKPIFAEWMDSIYLDY